MFIQVTTNKQEPLTINSNEIILISKCKGFTYVLLSNDESFYLIDKYEEIIEKIENQLFGINGITNTNNDGL